MKYKYKTVDTSTSKGIKQAEKLHAKGYKFAVVGIDKLMFTIPVKL